MIKLSSIFLYIGLLLISLDHVSRADDPANSPFADKPCNSYSNYTDDDGKPSVLIWGKAPLDDFGSREVKFDQSGVRSIRQVPGPGVHPRIFFGPDDLPDVRKRLKETQCGQAAWKNILSWTQMMKGQYDDKADYAQPDVWNGGFGGLHGRVPLFRLGVPRVNGAAYNHNPQAAAFYQNLIKGDATGVPDYYWNVFSLEAFRCLIENDDAGAKDLAKAVITLMQADQAKRAADPKLQGKIPDQPVGTFQLAFTYDFIFNWLTPDQKKAIHDELALSTWSHDNYGTFNTAESSRSNWATFSYWLYEVLAIEDEPGFNDLKVRGMYRGWHDLLTYGWYQSGATYEGEAKNQIGMDGVLLFASRAQKYGFENLCGHPYLQSYARTFLPHSINPMQTGFNKYDLLGGSRAGSGGFSPCDMLGLRYMFPDDKVMSWVYRKAVGENYEGVPQRPDGYYNGLLFYAIYASDFDPAVNDPNQLGLGNTFFCGERSLMMTRSGWDTDATMLNMHVRAANGGHPFADRNAIMVAGAGRIWSPNGYANFKTQENSVVDIDGKTQDVHSPARTVDFQDNPQATFIVGDAKYAWDWNLAVLNKKRGYYTEQDIKDNKVEIPAGAEPEKHTPNDFAYTKLPFAYLNRPLFELPHWILPNGALSPTVRTPNYPVQRAFRTAGLVRGPQPYALVVDDIQKDATAHHYDWTLGLERDIQIAKMETKSDGETDILLTGADPDQKLPPPKEALPSSLDPSATIPKGQPMLLVRVLNMAPPATTDKPAPGPEIVESANMSDAKKYGPIRRLVIPSDSVSPDFKVLLFAYRQGAELPATTWNADHTSVSVAWKNQTDTISFSPTKIGKTNVTITRGSDKLVDLTKEVAPFE
jgi:hypothetical protein